MKLLGNEIYCIKVDYFMWDSEKDEQYEEPVFLGIDTSTPANLLIFDEKITSRLRIFDTETEAKDYLKNHNTGNGICFTNPRVTKIKYNFEKEKWEES